MTNVQTRRCFLSGLSAAGAAPLFGRDRSFAAPEPRPETTTVRLPKFPRTDCLAAEYVAGELLAVEGFNDVRFVTPASTVMGRGEIDFDFGFVPIHVSAIADGAPIKLLAGLHSGCLELTANDRVQSVKDLKGKRVGIDRLFSEPHVFVSLMVSYIGLDPKTDIQWIENESVTAMSLFIKGEIDAFLAIPPEPQELRARRIGHTILNSTVDPPWSQYFCCMVSGSADYVSLYPFATKRVLRAIIKAAELCASSPEIAAGYLVEHGFSDRYDYAVQTLREVRYDRWRDFDPEDSIRFYANRMHEAGMIKSSPQKIIDEGADWRFLDKLKRELKT
ncbi:MAG: NitT/TauT family transport system substrate-binding protein [Alphaproteobacteria bacterium]|jgi:NitT/TauT family transport system substrate-binding protein|nr:NitT/TauT family transport system substrate-binding protein [Alphaproteobacteria bacterium]